MSAAPGRIAAAILLPPLGVFLARGPDTMFVIACILTLAGFLPGVIFALWCVLTQQDRAALA